MGPSGPASSPERGAQQPAAQEEDGIADLDPVSEDRTHEGTAPRAVPPASPYAAQAAVGGAQAAVEPQRARRRTPAGAPRVSVWVHEASTEMAVPYRQSVAGSSDAAAGPQLRTAVMLSRSPFLPAVIRSRRSLEARADGRRASDKELAERGIRSAHGEPLLVDGEVVGVLTVEPAAAAAPICSGR